VTLLALIRHAPTEWNAAGRLQGSRDLPLDPATLPQWRLPPELAGFHVLMSPLRRACDTAALLGCADAVPDPRLTEMDWGRWEGETIAALRARLGTAMDENEARGLDFRPEGGESPRDVQRRVLPLLAEIAADGRSTVAVTHKGVIRAVFALAIGWDLRGKAPIKLSWTAAHLFRLDAAGHPGLERLNIPLVRR
jgi:probable phosphoglycerate mutase